MAADRTVAGYCPACGSTTLFLGAGGFVTCSLIDCPKPTAAAEILGDRETQHLVTIGDDDFTVRHPLIERLDGELEACVLHAWIRALSGPPRRPGRYRVWLSEPVESSFWSLIS